MQYANDNALLLGKVGGSKHFTPVKSRLLSAVLRVCKLTFCDLFVSSGQSLRGSLLAMFYASTVLSGFTTAGLLLLAKQLSSEKE